MCVKCVGTRELEKRENEKHTADIQTQSHTIPHTTPPINMEITMKLFVCTNVPIVLSLFFTISFVPQSKLAPGDSANK